MSLKSVKSIGTSLFINELELNLKAYLDWEILGAGGWVNIDVPTTGAYGGTFSTLRLVDDPNYTKGQVWEGVRKDWVWETGVEWTGGDTPNTITGVIVDSNGYGTGHVTYGHHINYPLGRVIFDSAINTSATVELRHAYRYVQVYRADDVPWFRELQFRSFRPDSVHVDQTSSGDWSIGSQQRIQMPTIIVEAVPRGGAIPHQLGDGRNRLTQDVLFHIFAEDRWTRNNLTDLIRYQTDNVIWLFDSNKISEANAYPLDYRGQLVGSAQYPDFISQASGFRFRKVQFINTFINEIEPVHPNLHQGAVRITMESLSTV